MRPRTTAVLMLVAACLPGLVPDARARLRDVDATPRTDGPRLRGCADVTVGPGGEQIAAEIRVRGASCAVAHRVARRSRGAGPTGRAGRILRYAAHGFRCHGRELDTPLPAVRWRCRRWRARVTFERT